MEQGWLRKQERVPWSIFFVPTAEIVYNIDLAKQIVDQVKSTEGPFVYDLVRTRNGRRGKLSPTFNQMTFRPFDGGKLVSCSSPESLGQWMWSMPAAGCCQRGASFSLNSCLSVNKEGECKENTWFWTATFTMTWCTTASPRLCKGPFFESTSTLWSQSQIGNMEHKKGTVPCLWESQEGREGFAGKQGFGKKVLVQIWGSLLPLSHCVEEWVEKSGTTKEKKKKKKGQLGPKSDGFMI